jgi:hypothetical protein
MTMGLFTPRSTEGRDLESRGLRLRSSGTLAGQRNGGFLRRQAVQADIDRARRVAHADSKARNGGR